MICDNSKVLYMGEYLPTLLFKRLYIYCTTTISYSLNSLFLRIRKNFHSILHCIAHRWFYPLQCTFNHVIHVGQPHQPHQPQLHTADLVILAEMRNLGSRQPGAGDQSSQRNFAEVSQYSERATTFALTLMNLTKFYLWKSVPISGDLTMFKTPV